MGNDDTGRGKGFQDADDPLPGFRVQPVGGLVEQQGFRLHHKDRSQRDQFLLAPGQAVRQPVFEPGQPEPLQRGRRTIPGFVLSAAKIQRPKGHVFQHRGTEKLILGVLEDQAHLAAQFPKVLFRFQRTPVKEDTAFLRCRQPHDQPEQRCFTRTVRS